MYDPDDPDDPDDPLDVLYNILHMLLIKRTYQWIMDISNAKIRVRGVMNSTRWKIGNITENDRNHWILLTTWTRRIDCFQYLCIGIWCCTGYTRYFINLLKNKGLFLISRDYSIWDDVRRKMDKRRTSTCNIFFVLSVLFLRSQIDYKSYGMRNRP